MTKEDVISQCYIAYPSDDGINAIIKLPDVQLDRSVYNEVKKHFDAINGKWDKYAKGFVFPDHVNVQLAFAKLQAGKGETPQNVKKLYQFYGTPSNIADEMAYYLKPEANHRILEPSAGQGALIQAIHDWEPNVVVDCFELMPSNREVLKQLPNVNILGNDFMAADNLGEYDIIIANPPFAKNQDIDHFRKMYAHLAPHGALCAIMSKHWTFAHEKKCVEFRDWFYNEIGGCDLREIEAGEFKESGTNISCMMVGVVK